MKPNRIICFVIALIAFLAIGFMLLGNNETIDPIYVTIMSDNHTQRVNCWNNGQNDLFVFAPGYAELSNTQLRLNTNNTVTINDIVVTDGMECSSFVFNETYLLNYSVFGKNVQATITFLKASDIPAMFLFSESGSMEYIHSEKDNQEAGRIEVFDADGNLHYTGNVKDIHGRGNASWTDYEKKPYTLDLEQEANLLDMGTARKWILLANAGDHSHMRNKIVYDFAEALGMPYSPSAHWVDLYLNGEYAGLYLLAEKIEVHPQRVAIDPDESFLVSIEPEYRLSQQNLPYIITEKKQALRIYYPEMISDTVSAQMTEIWQSVENALMASDGIDANSGKELQDLIDVDSWARNYLIDEIFGNIDGFLASRFFYYNGSDTQKIYAGPVWDYDKAIGNDTDPNWSIADPNILMLSRYSSNYADRCVWTNALLKNTLFMERLKEILVTEMLPATEKLLEEKIVAYAERINLSAQSDAIRWAYGDAASIMQAVAQVKSYIQLHTSFLEDVWLEGKTYHQVGFINIENDQFVLVSPGGYLSEVPTIPDSDADAFIGWNYVDTNEPFDISKQITENIDIYAKWETESSDMLKQIGILIPSAIAVVMCIWLLALETKRIKKSG